MCGIAGYTGSPVAGLLDQMIAQVRSRGPDGDGSHHYGDVHFGHTRLAIIDIAGGAQPMPDDTGRIVVNYNGEIYNYEALKDEIERAGGRLRTRCDTEVIPVGYRVFGDAIFDKLNGMFACALHDERNGSIVLTRDRWGIKPLYYAIADGRLLFASRASALACYRSVSRRLDPDAVREYLQFRYSPGGKHFHSGVHVLPPGHLAHWKDGKLDVRAYWQPSAHHNGSALGAQEWAHQVSERLENSIRMQLRSDVPMGVLLSGGLDSTGVLHFARRATNADLCTFTFSIGDAHDESNRAAAIARSYGAENHTIRLPNRKNLNGLYDAVKAMDMPVGDAIVLPTYLLCKEVASSRKVVLTGEGADELFGGYVHFSAITKLKRLHRAMPWLPHFSWLVRALPVAFLDRFFHYQASLGQLGRTRLAGIIASLGHCGELARKCAAVLDDEEIDKASVLAPVPAPPDADISYSGLALACIREWLPNQILNKMDQLSMAHGLEARVPYLDNDLADLVSRAPEAFFVNGQEKMLLREALAVAGCRFVRQPKLAFHLPVESVHRDGLTGLAREWLSPAMVKRHGILRDAFVREQLAQLDRGEFLASKRVTSAIILHMWLEANGGAL